MRIFNEMPAQYIVREVEHLSEKHRILYGKYSNSDSLYAWVVGGSLLSEYIEKHKNYTPSQQDISPIKQENGFPVIEISKEQCIEFYLNRAKEDGERFVFLQILYNNQDHWPTRPEIYYVPLDRLELESSTENLSKNT